MLIFCFVSYYRYGCTKIVISDQSREFINKVNMHLFQLLGTEHRVSSSYRPQTNGLVERFNQTLQSLVKLVNKHMHQDNWDEYIDCVLFAYRSSKHHSTNVTYVLQVNPVNI